MAASNSPIPPADLEYVACNLCGADDTELILQKDGFDIVRCRRCGLGYVNPRLTARAAQAQYDADYYAGGSYTDYAAERAGYEKTFEYRLAKIERGLGGRGRILDVGCAYGFFLAVAARRGWEAHGIDVAEDAVRYARETLGLSAQTSTLSDAPFADGYFDAAVMNDTFEHVSDPLCELRQVFHFLRPGGIIALVTQDSRGPAVRLLGRRWPQWKPREHLYYYTRPTLCALLAEAGFESVSVRTEGLYCTVDFLTDKLTKVARPVGRAASSVARGLYFNQVRVPVWTGYEVMALAIKPFLRERNP
jgi:SAM-dependent methyltransferase